MKAATGRRRLDTESRRQEIVEAVLDVLAHRDVGQVSMQDIAAQAGSSPALIHHYFGTKLALAEAALTLAADQLIARWDLVPDAEIEEFLNTTLTTYLDFLEEHPASWAALLRGVGNPTLASIARRVDDHATGFALRKLAELDLTGPMIETGVRGWLELVKGTCLTWLSSGEPSRDVLKAFLAHAFMGCVEAASVAAERP
ncbi:MAG: TetR/AcrR family transcriptional regulator [Aeromicrobium sp.]